MTFIWISSCARNLLKEESYTLRHGVTGEPSVNNLNSTNCHVVYCGISVSLWRTDISQTKQALIVLNQILYLFDIFCTLKETFVLNCVLPVACSVPAKMTIKAFYSIRISSCMKASMLHEAVSPSG